MLQNYNTEGGMSSGSGPLESSRDLNFSSTSVADGSSTSVWMCGYIQKGWFSFKHLVMCNMSKNAIANFLNMILLSLLCCLVLLLLGPSLYKDAEAIDLVYYGNGVL